MYRFAFALACLIAGAGWSRGVSPNPADLAVSPELQVKTRALVMQLGSDDYIEREAATKQLAALGRLARPALLLGANTSDSPEVRLRCTELLPAADALDFKVRIETFLADADDNYEHDFPGWHAFRATVCREWAVFGRVVWSDKSLETAAREIFVQLISTKDNRRLMTATGGSRAELTRIVMERRQEFLGKPATRVDPLREAALDDVTVLLFAEIVAGWSHYSMENRALNGMFGRCGYYVAARGQDAKSRVYRAVAAAWLDSRSDPLEMCKATAIAGELGLNDQMGGLAARLLGTPGVKPGLYEFAAATLVRAGGKRHIRLLEKATGNETILFTVPITLPGERNPSGVNYDIQHRDLALAVSILLAELKPEDFGFTDNGDGQSVFSHTRHYFRDDETRKKAFAKWAERRKAGE